MRPVLQSSEGATLIEVLLAVLLIGIGMLAVAPMFLSASRSTATSGDLGIVGATGVERMELLRQEDFDDLTVGGSLLSNTTGYFDDSNEGIVARWTIADNPSPTGTKSVTVWVGTTTRRMGPRTELTLTTLRGR